MKVLLTAAELAPLAPAGGVAQYVMGLARALKRKGHDVSVAIPKYGFQGLDEKNLLAGISVRRIESDEFFGNVKNAGAIYRAPNFVPWIRFAQAIVAELKSSGSMPDVVHCQDAHSCLVPLLIAEERHRDPDRFGKVATVLTIHNLLEQGKLSKALFDSVGIPEALFGSHFEYYGDANCYKAGLIACDRVTTVSSTYAREIISGDEFGFGLAGVLNHLRHKPIGIVNGVDGTDWSMPGIRYDGSDKAADVIRVKREAKCRLLSNWTISDRDPILTFKARWDRQKGIDLLIRSMEPLLESACCVFDTWGEPKNDQGQNWHRWQRLKQLEEKYPLRLAVNVPGTTSPAESAALYSLGDMLLMPSVYEPCGLAQMECQRFGCIPIVRRTGGLADTVQDFLTGTNDANGFVFNTMTKAGLLSAVNRAVTAFHDKKNWHGLICNALAQKNDWDDRVSNYESLYMNARTP
jgi:starch synthase